MKPRRSRFNRIYRRLTRRAPNRQAQWRQISTLRAPGSAGYPAREACRRVYVPDELAVAPFFESGAMFQPPERDAPESRNKTQIEPEVGPGGGAAVNHAPHRVNGRGQLGLTIHDDRQTIAQLQTRDGRTSRQALIPFGGTEMAIQQA